MNYQISVLFLAEDTWLYTCNFDLHSAEELIQLVSKLEQSTDVDASCRLSRQILDFLELHVTDYRTNQVRGSMLHMHSYPSDSYIVPSACGWLLLTFLTYELVSLHTYTHLLFLA